MQLQHMAQNSFFMDAIDRKVMQVASTLTVITASLARNIMLKTTHTFLKVYIEPF